MSNATVALKALIKNLKSGSLAEIRGNELAAALVCQAALRAHGYKANACETTLVVKNVLRQTVASIPLVSLHVKPSISGAALQEWIVVDLTGVSTTQKIIDKALKKLFTSNKKPWGTRAKMEPWRPLSSEEFLDPVNNPVISHLVATWSSIAKDLIGSPLGQPAETPPNIPSKANDLTRLA